MVDAELVSWSAVLTLKHAGCHTALMTTAYPSPESYAVFNAAGKSPLMGVDVATRTRVSRIIGKPALLAIEIENLDTGDRRIIECDTLVLTGDWIPDHELARAAGLAMDPKTQGPLVDTASRTSRPGVFAIGNLLHPVDTADIAALDGRHVAEPVRAYLHGQTGPSDGIRILAEPPLRWISPGILRPGDIAPARNRLLLWTDTLVRIPWIVVRQDGNVIARKSLPWPASPGRVFRVPAGVLDKVNAYGGPVTLSLGINGGSKHDPQRTDRMNDVAARTVELRLLTHRPAEMTEWWAALLGGAPQSLNAWMTAIHGDSLQVVIERSGIALDYHPEASGVTAINLALRDVQAARPALNRLSKLGSQPHQATGQPGVTALWFRDPNGTDVALHLPVAIGHHATAAGVWPDEVDPKDVVAYINSQPSATIHQPPESE